MASSSNDVKEDLGLVPRQACGAWVTNGPKSSAERGSENERSTAPPPSSKNFQFLLVLLMWVFSAALQAGARPVSFSEFLSWVESGQVSQVTVTGNEITGTTTVNESFATYAPAQYEGLANKLVEHNVAITARETTPSPWPPVLHSWVTALLVIALWVSYMPRSQAERHEPILFSRGRTTLSLLRALLFPSVIVIVGILHFSASVQPRAGLVAFSDFMSWVESGQVSQVTITGNEITGTTKADETFTTYAPHQYEGLANKLVDRRVMITAREATPGPWPPVLYSWAPALLVAAFWIFFTPQAQTGGHKGLSFGNREATLLSGTQKDVTDAGLAACLACRTTVKTGAKFCPKCGSEIVILQ